VSASAESRPGGTFEESSLYRKRPSMGGKENKTWVEEQKRRGVGQQCPFDTAGGLWARIYRANRKEGED